MAERSSRIDEKTTQVLVCPASGPVAYVSPSDTEGIRSAVEAAGRPVWVDLPSTDEQPLKALQGIFQLHPLAVEDCMHLGHRATLDQYVGHLFFLMVTLRPDEPMDLEHVREVEVFLRSDLVVTIHAEPIVRIKQLRERVNQPPHCLSRGPDGLMHLIVDHAVDAYFAATAVLEDQLDELQERAFDPDDRDILELLFALRRQIVELRRHAMPLQDAVRPLADGDHPLISHEAGLHFRDVYDHIIRVNERLEMCRDLVTSCVDSHYSIVSTRTNEIMKVLSIVATVILPMTFVTSYLGMNLEGINSVPHCIRFWGAHGIMAATAGALVWWFRKKQWF